MEKFSTILVCLFLFYYQNLFAAGPFSRTDDTKPDAPEIAKKYKKIGVDLSLGGTLLKGNVDNVSLNHGLLFNATFKNKHSIIIQSNNMYSSFNDTAVLNKVVGSFLYTYGLLKKLNLYYYNTDSYNQFLKLNYRLTNGAGFCFHNLWDKYFDIILFSFGLTYENEWFKDNIYENALRGVSRIQFILPLTKFAKLGSDFLYTPKVDEFTDYRISEDFYVLLKITEKLLNLKISFIDEFDSRPKSEIKRNDVSLVTSLVFSFGN